MDEVLPADKPERTIRLREAEELAVKVTGGNSAKPDGPQGVYGPALRDKEVIGVWGADLQLKELVGWREPIGPNLRTPKAGPISRVAKNLLLHPIGSWRRTTRNAVRTHESGEPAHELLGSRREIVSGVLGKRGDNLADLSELAPTPETHAQPIDGRHYHKRPLWLIHFSLLPHIAALAERLIRVAESEYSRDGRIFLEIFWGAEAGFLFLKMIAIIFTYA
ncbi:MAG: hypothetical protein Q8P97_01310 [bacterium]|nr:hypothetical protein [bacterium]